MGGNRCTRGRTRDSSGKRRHRFRSGDSGCSVSGKSRKRATLDVHDAFVVAVAVAAAAAVLAAVAARSPALVPVAAG